MTIPNTNEIKMFFHCAACAPLRPKNVAPRDFAMIEAGWTELGLQVWCRRCEANIIHVSFEGAKLPANMTRKANA